MEFSFILKRVIKNSIKFTSGGIFTPATDGNHYLELEIETTAVTKKTGGENVILGTVNKIQFSLTSGAGEKISDFNCDELLSPSAINKKFTIDDFKPDLVRFASKSILPFAKKDWLIIPRNSFHNLLPGAGRSFDEATLAKDADWTFTDVTSFDDKGKRAEIDNINNKRKGESGEGNSVIEEYESKFILFESSYGEQVAPLSKFKEKRDKWVEDLDSKALDGDDDGDLVAYFKKKRGYDDTRAQGVRKTALTKNKTDLFVPTSYTAGADSVNFTSALLRVALRLKKKFIDWAKEQEKNNKGLIVEDDSSLSDKKPTPPPDLTPAAKTAAISELTALMANDAGNRGEVSSVDLIAKLRTKGLLKATDSDWKDCINGALNTTEVADRKESVKNTISEVRTSRGPGGPTPPAPEPTPQNDIAQTRQKNIQLIKTELAKDPKITNNDLKSDYRNWEQQINQLSDAAKIEILTAEVISEIQTKRKTKQESDELKRKLEEDKNKRGSELENAINDYEKYEGSPTYIEKKEDIKNLKIKKATENVGEYQQKFLAKIKTIMEAEKIEKKELDTNTQTELDNLEKNQISQPTILVDKELVIKDGVNKIVVNKELVKLIQEAKQILSSGSVEKIKKIKVKILEFLNSDNLYRKNACNNNKNEVESIKKQLENYLVSHQQNSPNTPTNKFPWWIVIPIVAVLAIVVGLIVVQQRRRNLNKIKEK